MLPSLAACISAEVWFVIHVSDTAADCPLGHGTQIHFITLMRRS